MEYSIYKDDKVESTVDRILRIFNEVGIEVKEEFYDVPTSKNCIPGYSKYPSNCKFLPYSSRISLFGNDDIGTNGKGTSKENSRASAYSEFMERLQNQSLSNDVLMLTSDNFYFAPDEKGYDESTENFISKYNFAEILSVCIPKKINNRPMKKISIPYFNVKDKNVHYLPPIRYMLTANGMTAGNTPGEALVQGFSEICERYSHREVFIKKLPMADIPKKYYTKYERLKGLIEYTEKLGWNVRVKDASLGKGLPVICTIFENPDIGYFSYKFASQPSLPIAIERTLTEFFQGGMRKDAEIEDETLKIDDFSEKGMKNIYTTANTHRWFFKINGKIHKIFSKENPDYKFSPSSWVDEDRRYTNKELLKFIVDKIMNVTDNDIYVRDVSFLGFPSYHIFIPDISQTIFYDKGKLSVIKWVNYEKEDDDPFYNIDSLIFAISYSQKFKDIARTIGMFIPDEYLLVLCYILKNDTDNIIKYCEILKKLKEPDFAPEFVSKHESLINLIHQYYKLKQQKESKTVINNIINNLYSRQVIQEFYDLINTLDFEYIKDIIAKSKEKSKNNDDCETQEEINMRNKIRELKQRLMQKYIENTPDQMELSKVFDFSDIN